VNQKDLTPPPPIADDKGAKQVHEQAPPNHHADTAARTQRPVHASQPDQSSGVRAAASAWVESFDGLKSAEFALRQSALSDQKLGTEQRSAIADLLRSVARLLDGV
jgi:hypothetical protein